MSLTKQDLSQIRSIVLEAVEVVVEPRFEDMENRFDGLESQIGKLETEVNSLKMEISGLSRRVSSLEEKVDGLSGRVTALENDIKELYDLAKHKPHTEFGGRKYQKLPDHEKIKVLDREIVALAKHLKVPLGR